MRHAPPTAWTACTGGFSCWQAGCSRIIPATTCAEQLSSSIGRAWAALTTSAPACTAVAYERRCGSMHECATGPTHGPRAWEATAGGRPAAAASYPPLGVVSSSVPRYIAEGSTCHGPTSSRETSARSIGGGVLRWARSVTCGPTPAMLSYSVPVGADYLLCLHLLYLALPSGSILLRPDVDC